MHPSIHSEYALNPFSHRFSLSLIAHLSFYSKIFCKVNPQREHADLLCIFLQSQYLLNFAGRSQAARVLRETPKTPSHTDSQTGRARVCVWGVLLVSQTFHLGGLPVTSVTDTVPLVVAGTRQSALALMTGMQMGRIDLL